MIEENDKVQTVFNLLEIQFGQEAHINVRQEFNRHTYSGKPAPWSSRWVVYANLPVPKSWTRPTLMQAVYAALADGPAHPDMAAPATAQNLVESTADHEHPLTFSL